MAECRKCREAARIARELAYVAEDLGVVYGIVTGTGGTRFTTERAAGRPIFKSQTSKKIKSGAKRTVSKYQKSFGKHLKRLKKEHPRTAHNTLMKRAHIAARKECHT